MFFCEKELIFKFFWEIIMFARMTNLGIANKLLTTCFFTCIFLIDLEVRSDRFYIDSNAQKQYLKEVISQGNICLTGKHLFIQTSLTYLFGLLLSFFVCYWWCFGCPWLFLLVVVLLCVKKCFWWSTGTRWYKKSANMYFMYCFGSWLALCVKLLIFHNSTQYT